MVPLEQLADSLDSRDIVRVEDEPVETTLQRASEQAGEQGRVVIAGSLYLVGAIRPGVKLLTEPLQSAVP